MEAEDVRQLVDKLKTLSKKLHVYGVERLVIAAQRANIEAPSLSVLRESARIAIGTEPVKQILNHQTALPEPWRRQKKTRSGYLTSPI